MAQIGKTIESKEATAALKYIGVAPVQILALNPTKAELEKIYGRIFENEPSYLSKTTVKVNGVDVEKNQVRLNFVVKVSPFVSPFTKETINVDDILNVTFFLTDEQEVSKSGKIKVCNIYGRTTWVDPEYITKKESPYQYFDAEGMRPTYRGEEDLIEFLKALLNIPNLTYKNANGEFVPIDNPKDAYFQLDDVAKYFSGNLKEIKDILKLLPGAKVKVCFGVRSNNGKTYQTAYTRKFAIAGSTNYEYMGKAITEDLKYRPNVEFEICDLKVYDAKATTFKADDAPTTTVEEDNNLPF